MAKNKKRNKRREAFWRGVMQRQRRSGFSVSAFCRREKLREPSFYRWRRKLAQRDAAGRGGCKAAFVPVTLAPTPTPPVLQGKIEIELPHGGRIHLTPPVDRQALADVLAVLSLGLAPREGRPC